MILDCELRLRRRSAVACLGLLRQDLVSVIFKCLGFGQVGQCLLNLRVPVGHGAQSLQLSKLAAQDHVLDVDLDPVHVGGDVVVVERNLDRGEELFEICNHSIVGLKVSVDGAVGQIVRCVVKEGRFDEQFILEVIGLGALDLFVRRNAAAAVDGAARVGHLDLAIGGVGRLRAGVIVVVVVERNSGVVAG